MSGQNPERQFEATLRNGEEITLKKYNQRDAAKTLFDETEGKKDTTTKDIAINLANVHNNLEREDKNKGKVVAVSENLNDKRKAIIHPSFVETYTRKNSNAEISEKNKELGKSVTQINYENVFKADFIPETSAEQSLKNVSSLTKFPKTENDQKKSIRKN
ncbi:MAG: hypothetical protein LBJ09_03185 [Clostridiales bacterium]|nr:hypothetical protein [Clostridiales bacterium]